MKDNILISIIVITFSISAVILSIISLIIPRYKYMDMIAPSLLGTVFLLIGFRDLKEQNKKNTLFWIVAGTIWFLIALLRIVILIY